MSETLAPPQPSSTYDSRYLDTTVDMDNNYSTNYTSNLLPPLFIPCNNPRNIIRPFVVAIVDLVVYVGILPVLGIFGVTTNVINMVVFAKQGLSNRINVCLFSLAVSDTAYLLSTIAATSYVFVNLVDPVAGSFWKQLFVIVSSRPALLGISNIITAIIAAERCLCVLRPLKAAKFFKTKYMATAIAVMAVYILAVKHSGLLIKYQTVQVTDPVTNISTYINRLRPFYLRHRTIIDINYLHLVSVVLPCMSLILVVICTAAIIIRLKVTATWRRGAVSKMTSVEKQEMSMTRMLVTVCCVFVVCMIPSVTRVLLFTTLPGFLSSGYLCNVYRLSLAIVKLLEMCNASINFLIYVKQSSQYQSTLHQLCSRGKQEMK